MRSGIILLALVAAATATPVYQRAADQDLLKKQQDTIHLLKHISQTLPNQELHDLGLNYDIESNIQQYHEPTTVQYYIGMVKAGQVQPKGTVFSNSISHLRKEVALLSRILLAAKDYSTFLQTAAWARIHVNEVQFVRAYIAAILRREDCLGIIPPPLYEIFPQHYIDSRVIQEAQNINIKQGYLGEQTVVIPVNYTDYLPYGENQLSYFTQDIGLNAYYAYVSLAGYMIPEHLHQQKSSSYQQVHGSDYEKGHHIGYGSYYYYLHQQLLARYNLNRLSSGLGPIDNVDFENVKAAYKPHLRHSNGLEYPGRPNELHVTPYHQDLVKNVHAFEKRLLNAIDSGYVITPQQQFLSLYQPQGLNILGDLISGTGRSVNPRYYGSLQAVARQLLGNTPDFENIWSYTPSALELSESSVRDPAFYQLYKRIIKLFQRYQLSLPAYQYDDLVLPGVKIQKVIFPNLVTYFDQYSVDLDNSIVHPVNVGDQQQQELRIKAQLHRLNHKQYEYQVIVNSEKPHTNAVVRVYLGPKYDYNGQPIDINQHRLAFVELDQFVHDLQEGENVIVRNSQQTPITNQDYPSVHQIKTHVDSAVRSQNPFYITEPQQIFGFPDRLSVPKGRYGGLPLQVFVIISSSHEVNVPYGPVIPAEFQTYQQHQFQIVDGVQYEQYSHQIQQQQQGVQHGGHQTLEVLPTYHGSGVYGNQLNKLQAYYGHYLYRRYPNQYPFLHSHQYMQGQGVGQQQHGGYQWGVHQQQGVHGYGQQYQQYMGQQHGSEHGGYVHHQGQLHQGQVHQGQLHQGQFHQGQILQGQHYQGQMPQGQLHQGQIPEGQLHQGQVPQGQLHQGQIFQGHHQQIGQGVQQEPIETVQQEGVYHGQGIHGIGGGYTGVVYPGGVQSGVVGGQSIHGVGQGSHTFGQHVQPQYLKKYYNSVHISHIIGGALSLDGKPLGYPLQRPLAPSVLYVPNIHVTDVIVHHVDQPIEGIY